MTTRTPPVSRTRRMTDDELAEIRRALKRDGIPVYPERILVSPEADESALRPLLDAGPVTGKPHRKTRI